MIIVRYADDSIIGFQHESDARRFRDAIRERLKEFSLSLHPDKTGLIRFGRFAAAQRAERGLGKPETFKFLGFTLICGQTRQGRFALQRKTRGERMRAKLKEIKKELRRRMHQPIPEQGDRQCKRPFLTRVMPRRQWSGANSRGGGRRGGSFDNRRTSVPGRP